MPQRHLRSLLGERSWASFLVWAIAIAGIALPWCIGTGVKLYLDAQGKPTWDWLYFLHPGTLLAEIWATAWLAAPSLLLALFAALMFCGRIEILRRFDRIEMTLVVLPSATWGGYASALVFIEMFRVFHPVAFLLPFFYTVLYAGYYLLGLLVGLALAAVVHTLRQALVD
ncbi:MAG: hypothetical protein OEW35_13105 [Gammaproteobacteria bacterium]|nr:hypothetical protein [Gammaproteobacteria bacterium]